MDDVEVLPPHTGIVETSKDSILEILLAFMMLIPLTLNITKIEEK